MAGGGGALRRRDARLLASRVNRLAPAVPHDRPFSVSCREAFAGGDAPTRHGVRVYWQAAPGR
jgi:hypothetical protein